MSGFLLLAAVVHIVCPHLVSRIRYGVEVTRESPEGLLISWGFHGIPASPDRTLEFFDTYLSYLAKIYGGNYPDLSHTDSVWMFDAEPVWRKVDPLWVAGIVVNPRLSNAEERVYTAMGMVEAQPPDWDGVTRMMAEGFVYLGWVVRDESEARALREALRDRSAVDFGADLATPRSTLRRIRIGVEEEFVSDPNDETALAKTRKQIPVMFESLNAKAGHPMNSMWVLYLDGHVEEIPFGERFPATQAIVDLFPPPPSSS